MLFRATTVNAVFILICWIFDLFNASLAQPKLVFRSYTVEDGLSHNFSFKVIQDSENLIWIATEDGLNRFDSQEFKVYNFDAKDSTSLSNNVVMDIAEDSYQNLWIATWGGGISIYNRELDNFTRLNIGPNKEHENDSLIDHIYDIYIDDDNKAWIGTSGNGLVIYDYDTKAYKHYLHNPDDPNSLSHNRVRSIIKGKDGKMWIGTLGGGLNLFDPKAETFIRYQYNAQDLKSISHDEITSLCYDAKGRLWVGTWDGLNIMDTKTGEFSNYKNNPDFKYVLSSNQVWSITSDSSDLLWIGSDDGLNLLDLRKEEAYQYKHQHMDAKSLSANSVKSVTIDKQNRVWICTFNGGVNLFDRNFIQFKYYNSTFQEGSLSYQDISATLETSDGHILIGTDGGGLNIFHRESDYFEKFMHNDANRSSISNDKIKVIFEDHKGRIWIGMWDGGLDMFDIKTKKFKHYSTNSANGKGPNNDNVVDIAEDKNGNLWLATFGGGINKFDPETETFTFMNWEQDKLNNLKGKFFWVVSFSYTGELMAGSNNGYLHLINPETLEINEIVKIQKEDVGSFSIFSILEDSKHKVWIGTQGGGLLEFNREKLSFNFITTEDGLISDNINGIVEYKDSTLWLTSNKGLSCFNPKAKTFKDYNTSFGLQSLQFNRETFGKLSTGELMLGGNNGLNIFHPDSLKDCNNIIPIVFTDFHIFNEHVAIAENGSPLTKAINETESIELTMTQSVFSIYFTALAYTMPEKIKYKYRLENFIDESWQYIGKEHKVTYTNLRPGEYKFTVMIDDPEITHPARTLHITVLPPWWEQWWFRIFVFLFLSTLAIFIYFIRINSVKKQNLRLEKLVTEKTKELTDANKDLREKNYLIQDQKEEIQTQAEELELYNTEVLAMNEGLEENVRQRTYELNKSNEELDNLVYRVSHDIRAPLSSVMGLIKLLEMERDPSNFNTYIKLANKSLNKLDTFVRDILDYSRNSRLIIGNAPINFQKMMEEVLSELMFMDNADRINIKTNYVLNGGFFSDEKRLEIIFRNIMSNAIKYQNYSVENSFLYIEIKQYEKGAYLIFEDNGIGIEEDMREKVFQMFFKASEYSVGSGIGLYIVQETVAKLGGNITLSSEFSKGTRFKIYIPNHLETSHA
ncbi:sensor histidine kinase [Chondrinema litorale]|uniref:sensor histidine kinase n=1 Tax=Chondrinema litorale TaxID=2994555 RepID=UPI002543F1EE|nr:sensor histidine kinase [Chondrinema litorale]UZR98320.1 ATP-binding protein [Chondrinema litorale]